MKLVSRLLSFVAAAWLTCGALSIQAADGFLDPEVAFKASARAVDARTIEVSFEIAPGYYLYRDQFRFEPSGATLGEPVIPAGHVKFDTTFEKNVETYRDTLRIPVPVTQAGRDFTLTVGYQGCADKGLCYPPTQMQVQASLAGFGGSGTVRSGPARDMTSPAAGGTFLGSITGSNPGAVTRSTASAATDPGVAFDTSPASVDVQDSGRLDRVLRGGRFWSVIAVFFAAGVLLSLTPCVLPMLPILSSIIVGESGAATPRRRGLLLAGSYSLGMALVYTALGVAAGLAGEGLAAALQTPLVLGAFALLLVVFSLSMFGVYDLQLPARWTGRVTAASQRLPAGRVAGVFVMGGVSALIVSPCVVAPLAGALVYISQTRDVALGGSALFALASGMSVPLLLLGASAGALLPRAGAWMDEVKRVFGVLLLGVAIWTVQSVLPGPLVLAAWGALLVGCAVMLVVARPPASASVPSRRLVRSAAATLVGVFGLLQLLGAASGGTDPLQPLIQLKPVGNVGSGSSGISGISGSSGNSAGNSRNSSSSSSTSSGGAGNSVGNTGIGSHNDVERIGSTGTPFRTVRSVAELDAALRAAGRPVMLDFYADWCVSCKEMDRFTFSDPVVAGKLVGALLLRVDVTANNADDRALLKRFALFGPPGTIFFDGQGREVAAARVVGYQDTPRFLQTLATIGL